MQETPVLFLGQEDPLEKGQLLPNQYSWASLATQLEEATCNVKDLDSISGLGRSPGEGKGYPLQYPGLENAMDSIVLGVTKRQTRLSNFHFHFTFLKVATKRFYLVGITIFLGNCYSAKVLRGLLFF